MSPFYGAVLSGVGQDNPDSATRCEAIEQPQPPRLTEDTKMAVKSLDELAKQVRNSPEMTPYPESLARCLGEMSQDNSNGRHRGDVRSTTFITASGLSIGPSELNRERGLNRKSTPNGLLARNLGQFPATSG